MSDFVTTNSADHRAPGDRKRGAEKPVSRYSKHSSSLVEGLPIIIGTAYQTLKKEVKKYAEEDLPVLLLGETGSGKEVFAGLYKSNSKRGDKVKKITINCASFPETLLQSEVFGHKKGTFTGAIQDRKGIIEECQDGILFLDELSDASPAFQAAILRVSEQNTYKILGSNEEKKSNALIIAAATKLSKIRPELRDRFHILPIPPLQRFDIPELSYHFLKEPLKEKFIEELMGKDYPGNVRALKRNCEKLRAEQGDSIFAKSKSRKVFKPAVFDYTKFRREYLLWEEFFAPIIEECDLKFRPPRYQYQAKNTTDKVPPEKMARFFELLDYVRLNERILPSREKKEMRIGSRPVFPTSYSIEEDESIVSSPLVPQTPYGTYVVEEELSFHAFITELERIIGEGHLAHYLDEVGRRFAHGEFSHHDEPDLSPLLALAPEEAKIGFLTIYLGYHLGKHSGDIPETAKALHIPETTLRSRLLRISKKAQAKTSA